MFLYQQPEASRISGSSDMTTSHSVPWDTIYTVFYVCGIQNYAIVHNCSPYEIFSKFSTAQFLFQTTHAIGDRSFLFKIFILQLIYNILSIYSVPQSDPVTHTHTHTYIYTHSFSHIFHHVPSQVIGYISLCYTARPHCLPSPKAMVFIC